MRERKHKKTLRRPLLCCLAMACCLTATSCGPAGVAGPQTPKAVGSKIYVIGQSEGVQFWDYVELGAKEAGEEMGYEVTYANASKITDIEGQITLINHAIDDGAKVIVIAPNDTTQLNEALRDAVDKGIQIVTIDATSDYAEVKGYIGTNNFSSGAIAARYAFESFKNPLTDKALIICHSESASSAQQRIGGFISNLSQAVGKKAASEAAAAAAKAAEKAKQEAEEAAKNAAAEGAPEGAEGNPEGTQGGPPANAQEGNPEGTQGGPPAGAATVDPIAAVQYCNGDADIAKQQTKDMLLKNPDIKVIYATNERSTLGVCEAVEELGYSDTVTVIGFNSNESEINYLKNGTLNGLIVQNPYNMGYLGVYYAGKLISGEGMARMIDTGATYITANDLEKDDIQLLLNPAEFAKSSAQNTDKK